MKKLLKILICITVYILIAAVIVISIYERHDVDTQEMMVSEYIHVEDNLYVDEKCDIEKALVMNEFVEELPSSFVTEFRDDWKVIIDDDIPTHDTWDDRLSITGYTYWQARIIVIKDQSDTDELLDVFAHELGHCFDFEYGSVSYSDIFNEYYSLYRDDFTEYDTDTLAAYSTITNYEFFATCFKEYLLYPEHLESEAPKVYIFVDDFYNDAAELKRGYAYDLGAVVNTLRRLTSGLETNLDLNNLI